MTEIFGHKWISSYGTEPTDTWLAGLIGYRNEDILEGIFRCLDWEKDWPPTLAQFRALCRHRPDYFVAEIEAPEVIQKRKESGFKGIADVRENFAYTEWTLLTKNRKEDEITRILRNMRAAIQVAKKLK